MIWDEGTPSYPFPHDEIIPDESGFYAIGKQLINGEWVMPSMPINDWHHDDCQFRIVAPESIVTVYPALLFDLAVVRKLQMEQRDSEVLIYCNYIESEHQALIDGSGGAIYIETKAV
jgi:hypothetical protein